MPTSLIVESTRAGLRVAVADVHDGQPRLLTIRSHPAALSVDATAQLAAWLKSVKRAGLSAVVVIPREQVIVRTVKFPSTQPSELAQMVELYAKAQLPYPREQAVVDFSPVRQEAGFSLVAVVACQREIVDRQLALLQGVQVPVAAVTVSSWGVLGWYQRAAELAAADEPVLVVNIDEARTDFVLAAGGRLLSSRSVGQGAQDWRGGADVVELLAAEVDRSRAAVKKELPDTDIRSILLTGLSASAQWREPLASRLGLPVSALPAEPPLGGVVPSDAAMSPVVVGGLALLPAGTRPNLSPPDVRVGLRHRAQVQQLTTLSGLLAATLVLAAALFGVQVLRQRRLAGRLDRVLAEITPTAKRVQEELRAAQLVDAVLQDRRQLAQVIAGVFRATPASIALDVLTFERTRGELTVRGSAGSTQEVLGYIQQLQSLEGIGSAELKFSTRRTTASGERTDFEVALRHGQAVPASTPARTPHSSP